MFPWLQMNVVIHEILSFQVLGYSVFWSQIEYNIGSWGGTLTSSMDERSIRYFWVDFFGGTDIFWSAKIFQVN